MKILRDLCGFSRASFTFNNKHLEKIAQMLNKVIIIIVVKMCEKPDVIDHTLNTVQELLIQIEQNLEHTG